MRREVALLLAVLLLSAALSGCTGRPVSGEKPAPTPEETSAPTPEPTPAPTPDCSLSWTKAFRDDSLPEGSLTPEEIAFQLTDGEGNISILNVPWKDVLAWWNEQETLPRTHYFEQFAPDALQSLYPVLDYAMANSYSCFCVPSTDFTPSDVAVGRNCLQWMYRINGNIISAESCGSFDFGDGKTLQYILITLRGMNGQGSRSEYQESIARAREIVAGIPKGSGDFEKILYLYNWLTENVVYYDVDDPYSYYNDDWNLLYDTLVKNSTVCAGYAEALYVMCNLADVECFIVMGSLYGGQGWGDHAWNVAKIDGEYYQFDSTWDAGSPPERYCFFGMSDETMQFFYRRLVRDPPEDFRQPCPRDLPVPGVSAIPADLSPGAVEDNSYSQPFADLKLSWDDSWTAYSREKISEVFYGGMELNMEQYLKLGTPYTDLALEKNGKTAEVLLELSPVQISDVLADSAELYMDTMQQLLPAQLEETGLQDPQTERTRKEICGRSYECLTVSGLVNGFPMTETFLCTERDGLFLTIILTSGVGEQWERTLQELLADSAGG